MNLHSLRLQFFTRLLLYGICAGVVTLIFLFHPGHNSFKEALFADMVDGTAYRPYVYRTLVPTGIRVLSAATPDFLKRLATDGVKDTRLFKKLGWEAERIPDYTIATLLFFGCFLGFAFALRSLTATVYPRYPLISEFTPMLGLITLPVFFRYYNHVYDPATLLLFTLCILFLTRQNLQWYYPGFVLAVLNKETSILLVPLFYVALRHTMPLSKILAHVSLQVMIYLGIKAAITYVFAENPGSFVELRFDYNFYVLTQPTRVLYVVLLYGIFGFLTFQEWSRKPLFLRSGLMVTLVPLMVLVVFFGNLDETRVFYEAFPFVLLLSLPTVMEIFGVNLYESEQTE